MKTGDKVRVISGQYNYSLYSAAAKAMNLTKWKYANSPRVGDVGTIVDMMTHPSDATITIVAVDFGASEMIIGAAGLEPFDMPIGARFFKRK